MLLERFIKYISIDTQSSEESNDTPSTAKQYDLLNILVNELKELEVDCELDQYGRIYGFIEGNRSLEPIGLCAHVDTALECNGKCDNYQIIKNYDGCDIRLGNTGLILSPNKYSKLNECLGKTIITTGGTSLLGADDKAGVAIIMSVIEEYKKIPILERHPFCILFTPDEEVGRGPEHFDAQKYGASFAYTIDGADPKYIEFENFNAKCVDIDITGYSIHPGDAKDKMVNAIMVLNEFISLLPSNKVPEKTSGYEGFNHATSISGDVEHAHAHFILRNHDASKLETQVNEFITIEKFLNQKYLSGKVVLTFKDQYRNMAEIIARKPMCKEHIEKIYKKLGIQYSFTPIRGGTDGATFSFLGCPCPNLGTGSYNHHGRYEFAVLEEMELLVRICTEIFKK